MKRKGFSLCRRTSICQKLPEEFENKLVNQLREQKNYMMGQIGNANETPVWLDMPSSTTITQRGAKDVKLLSTGNEHSRFTVMLASTADGRKLPPFVIFKRKTMLKEAFPPGVVVCVNQKGYMDEAMMLEWIQVVWNRPPGISGDISRLSTSFPHPCDPSRVVHTVIDPPHIFKCIRNNLLKVGKFLLPGDQEVFHFHYSALLEYEEQQAGLRTVPKLTTAHVNPNPFQKLSVKLAVQLFSESTASGMEFYARRDECKKLHMSAATVQFTRRMNDLYDCLNTKRPQQVQYNEAEHITTLKENIKWLDRWYEYIQTLPKQRQICFLSKPTSEALRLTLHSVVALIEYLLKSGFQYVLVGNFGQDPLERFFGITRHVAGDAKAVFFSLKDTVTEEELYAAENLP
ncbi:hypothetical protein MTO96_023435 [Rhipicephalus appendiculatus]